VSLERAVEAIAFGRGSLEKGKPAECISMDLKRALEHLGEVVGATSPEDVLDHIFTEFCIGK
jgi:tRNA modification GTPase